MFGGDRDPAALDAQEQRIDDWQTGFAERAARARELSRRVTGLTVTARSRDGLVAVTVASSGALTDLWLDEGVRRHSATWIAEQVLSVAVDARAQLVEQVRLIVAETVGESSPSGQAVLSSFAERFPPADRADDG